MLDLIQRPQWSLPKNISAAYSRGYNAETNSVYGALNLATHVGDERSSVAANREHLCAQLDLPRQPLWLNQVHGVAVAEAGVDSDGVTADAVVSRSPGMPAAVLTADCLPVLFYANGEYPVVAAAHAGWRGLAAGVLEQALEKMAVPISEVHCWLGPAIGPQAFEVGEEVREAFVADSVAAEAAFVAQGQGKFLADIYHLAKLRLRAAGVSQMAGGDFCTVTDTGFYSYRRAGQNAKGQPQPCGRHISMIWLNGE